MQDGILNRDYFPDPAERVRDRLKASFGDFFKQYYLGEALDIPKANLPCIMIQHAELDADVGATSTDDLRTGLTITLLIDKEDDAKAADDSINLSDMKLSRLLVGRDPLTGQYYPDTIYGSLRTNITLDSYTIQLRMDSNFDTGFRPNDVVTAEVTTSIVVTERVFVPNRT